MRLIDAEVLKMGKFHSNESWASVEQVAWQWGWNDAIDAIINAAPTVDAVEVVRCKDCRFCDYDEMFDEMWCDGKRVSADWFCADGERREDGKTNKC